MHDLMAQDMLWHQLEHSNSIPAVNGTNADSPRHSSTSQPSKPEQLQDCDEDWFHAGLLWLRPTLLNLDGNNRQELYQVCTSLCPDSFAQLVL